VGVNHGFSVLSAANIFRGLLDVAPGSADAVEIAACYRVCLPDFPPRPNN
jgi:hypothetical protein